MDEKQIIDKIKELKIVENELEVMEKEYHDVWSRRDKLKGKLLGDFYPDNYTSTIEARIFMELKELRIKLCEIRGE